MVEERAVVIVGGGPVGLSASLLLSDLGVDSLLLERNPTTTDHPKAHIVNTRTMEIFRTLGIADAVRAASVTPEMMGHVRWVRSLAGEELASLVRRGGALPPSPEPGTSCAQDEVERCLLAGGAGRRGEMRFGAEVTSVEPDGDGVTVRLAGSDRVRAKYVIAADGAASGVRDQLGIGMVGQPELATLIGTYFHADLRHLTEHRPALLYWVMNSAAPGTFVALDGVERWVFHVVRQPDANRVSETEAASLVRAAIGDPEIAIEVRSVKPWRMTAQIAERYQSGRVFLAGDAAHRFPPTGGLGLNTGVQDAHNLAWKLARVLAGRSSESLLGTYEQERRPIAHQNCEFSVHNSQAAGTASASAAADTIAALESGEPAASAARARLKADVEANSAHFGGIGMDLGFRYAAGALVPDGATVEAPDPGVYTPSGQVGARAPHLATDDQGGSILDHFGTGFVVLVAGSIDQWDAADLAVEIPAGEPYGLERGGAVLVRPDGHIAWRSIGPPDNPAATLARVRATIDCS